jgi:hypothetical protein
MDIAELRALLSLENFELLEIDERRRVWFIGPFSRRRYQKLLPFVAAHIYVESEHLRSYVIRQVNQPHLCFEKINVRWTQPRTNILVNFNYSLILLADGSLWYSATPLPLENQRAWGIYPVSYDGRVAGQR